MYDVRTQIAALKEDLNQPFYKEWDDLRQGRNWEELNQSEREAWDRIWNRGARATMNLRNGEIFKIRLAFINNMRTQVTLSQYMSLISPSAALTYLASDIADTGTESEWNFRRAVFRFHRPFFTQIDAHIEKTGDIEKVRHLELDNPPPFEYGQLDLIQLIDAHLPRIIVLLFYPILFFLGAQIAFIRSTL